MRHTSSRSNELTSIRNAVSPFDPLNGILSKFRLQPPAPGYGLGDLSIPTKVHREHLCCLLVSEQVHQSDRASPATNCLAEFPLGNEYTCLT